MKGLDPDEATSLQEHGLFVRESLEQSPFSKVYRVVHKATNRKHIVKTINYEKLRTTNGLSERDVEEEIKLCQNLQHPYICRLEDVICNEKNAHLIFENLEGGDICFEIVQRASSGFVFSEYVISHYTKQLLDSLNYIHSRQVVHRDIRPHNIVLATKDTSACLKLCGFGVAITLNPNVPTPATRVGVPQFMAPEVVQKMVVDCAADMWSAGVVLFLLLSGRLPFGGPSDKVYERIVSGTYDLNAYMPHVTESAKDLVSRLLYVDPKARITAKEALSHEWIKDKEHTASRRHMNETIEYMKRYNDARKLKSSIMSAVNSGKFSPVGPVSYIGSASPGGDCCHRDNSIEQLNNVNDEIKPPADLSPTFQVLSSLDAINCLLDSSAYRAEDSCYQQVSEDPNLNVLLRLYDKISALPFEPVHSEVEASSLQKQCVDSVQSLLAPSEEAQQLRNLLTNPHLSSCIQALDVIICEVHDIQRIDDTITGDSQNQCNSTSNSKYLNGGVLPLGSNRAGTSSENFNSTLPSYDDDDEDLYDCMSRLRLVQFQKDTQEPMGITLKVNEDGRCFVARIMHGGMIHRQATLHVGDEIREINGISVANRNVESLQEMLRDVTFKIIPSYRSAPPACEIFVRAQFDYEPGQDDLIPCPQAGVPFKTGDILQVISKDDHNWWQARFVSTFPSLGTVQNARSASQQVAGLIPSPELQEWRTACLAMERAKNTSHCMWFNKKKKYYTTKYLQKHSALFDQLDLVTYEEVMRLSQYRRKTLVLLGAHGVGRRHIKNTLIHRHPNRFAYPIPHTTRPPRKEEVDGKHYYFVSNDQMTADIQNNEYLEYGTHEDSMYGTKLETIRNIHKSGKIAILDVEPQALKVLRTAEYSPFVVFIAAPNLQGLQDPDGSLERLLHESDVLRQAFGHLFDYVVVNNDIDDTITQLERLVEKLPAFPQWLPVSWVY